MIKNNSIKISWFEAASILTVSQVFSTVAFSAQSQNKLNATATMIAFLLGTLINFLVIIPFTILNTKRKKGTLLEHSYNCLGNFTIIIAIAVFVVFIAVNVNTVVIFQKFLSDSVYQGSSNFIIISLLVIAASYGAFLGIEALGRFANIVFSLVSILILLILISLIRDIDWLNFGYVQNSDIKSIIKTSLGGVASNTGILASFMILPSVNKKHFKGFFLWNFASLAIVEIIVATVTGVLGLYGLAKDYPYYTATTIAQFSIFKRLDIVYLCIWIFVAFIKTTLYLYLSKQVLNTVLQKSLKKYSHIFCSAILLLLSYIASVKEPFNYIIKLLVSSGWVFIFFVIILPTVLILMRPRQRSVKNANF